MANKLRPDQYAQPNPIIKRAVGAVVRLAQTEIARHCPGADTGLLVTFHADPDVPSHIFKPPNHIVLIRPGDLDMAQWTLYRSGVLDCMASYWSYREHKASRRRAATAIVPSQDQELPYAVPGSTGWKRLRNRLKKLEQPFPTVQSN